MFENLLPPLASPDDPPEPEPDPDDDAQAVSLMQEEDSDYVPQPSQAVLHRHLKMGWMAYTDELGTLGVFEDHSEAAGFSNDFDAVITPVPLYLRRRRHPARKLGSAFMKMLEKLGCQVQPNVQALPASDPRHSHPWVP